MRPFNRYSPFLMPVLSSVVILAIWYGAGHLIVTNLMESDQFQYLREDAEGVRRIQLPYPTEIWQAIVDEREDLFQASQNTFTAAITGFLAAVTTGYLIAMLFASSIYVKQAIYPWILILQMTPVVILAPIIVIWIGPGLQAITLVTFLIGFFPRNRQFDHGLGLHGSKPARPLFHLQCHQSAGGSLAPGALFDALFSNRHEDRGHSRPHRSDHRGYFRRDLR